MSQPVAVFWFRRDLRLQDNAGLYYALRSGVPVVPVFIFDINILAELEDKTDKRVNFIHHAISGMQQQLERKGSTLHVFHSTPEKAFEQLAKTYDLQAVYTNHDYEPYATQRDTAIASWFGKKNIAFRSYKDQVIFEKNEVIKDDGSPYFVYTPYSKKWKQRLSDFYLKSYPVEKYGDGYFRQAPKPIPTLKALGFQTTDVDTVPPQLDEHIAPGYDKTRDYPGIHGTTRLSVHLRFGTISIRELARHVMALNEKLLNELIWRDFYFQILHHHPHVVGHSFRPAYDAIRWESGPQAEALFAAWCEGRTGYPLVDAAMAQLNQTGYMHNRLRMVTASFLVKDLGVDWRWGEAYFARQLNDFDLAANNGGWQWASSSGCDAQPYFRIFNPVSQSEKFDPEGKFIRRYLPQLAALPTKALHAPWLARPLELQEAGVRLGDTYPLPVVEHDVARQRTLERYAVVKTAAG